MVHAAPNTTSTVVSKSISKGGGSTSIDYIETSPNRDSLRLWQYVQVVAAATLVAAVWRLVIPTPSGLGSTSWTDDYFYLRMARGQSAGIPAPFAHRLLLPSVVHFLPFDTRLTFGVLALLCLMGSGIVMYALVRHWGAAHGTSALAMVALMSCWGFVFYVKNPYLDDPPALLACTAAFLLLARRDLILLSGALTVWVLAREDGLAFALPLYLALRQTDHPLRAASKAALVMLPPIGALALVVLLVPASGSNLSLPAVTYAWRVAHWHAPLWVLYAGAASLGVWWVIAVSNRAMRRYQPYTAWLFLVGLHFVVGTDWSRYALYGFPVVIVAASLVLQNHRARAILMALVILQIPAPLIDQYLGGGMRLNGPGPGVLWTGLLMLVAAGTLVLSHLRSPVLTAA